MKLLAAACLALAFRARSPRRSRDLARGLRQLLDRDNSERWVSIQLRRGDGFGTSGFGVPDATFPRCTDRATEGPIHFTLRRDAGSFVFDGRASNGRATATSASPRRRLRLGHGPDGLLAVG
jgi:hypothetical protein